MATNYDETNQYDLNAHYWLYQFTELDIIMKAIAIPKDRYFAEEEREDAPRNRDSSKVGKLIGNKGGTESSLVNNTLLTQVTMNNNRLRTVA